MSGALQHTNIKQGRTIQRLAKNADQYFKYDVMQNRR